MRGNHQTVQTPIRRQYLSHAVPWSRLSPLFETFEHRLLACLSVSNRGIPCHCWPFLVCLRNKVGQPLKRGPRHRARSRGPHHDDLGSVGANAIGSSLAIITGHLRLSFAAKLREGLVYHATPRFLSCAIFRAQGSGLRISVRGWTAWKGWDIGAQRKQD
jgi:hypothetical protein